MRTGAYTAAEDAVIVRYYATETVAQVQARLPHRSVASVQERRRRADGVRGGEGVTDGE